MYDFFLIFEDTNGNPQRVTFTAEGFYEADQYANSVWGDQVRSVPGRL